MGRESHGEPPGNVLPVGFVPFEQPRPAAEVQDSVDAFLEEQQRAAPSLPIILLSAVAGMATGLIGYSTARELGRLSLEWSVAIGTLALCFGVGATGALLSAATGSRAALANAGLGCAVILFSALFLGFCAVVGALAATLALAWGL